MDKVMDKEVDRKYLIYPVDSKMYALSLSMKNIGHWKLLIRTLQLALVALFNIRGVLKNPGYFLEIQRQIIPSLKLPWPLKMDLPKRTFHLTTMDFQGQDVTFTGVTYYSIAICKTALAWPWRKRNPYQPGRPFHIIMPGPSLFRAPWGDYRDDIHWGLISL